MKRIEKRVKEHYGATFSYDDSLVQLIVDRCKDPDTGARNIENILSRSILPELASECLQMMANGEEVENIRIGLDDAGAFQYSINA